MPAEPTTALLFGLSLTNAEFELLLEVAKAVLLALGVGFITFLFTNAAKKRELDTASFNELVKPQIACLLELNEKMVAAISEYEERVDALLNPVAEKERLLGSVDYLTAIDKAREAIRGFCGTGLPAKLEEIRRYARRNRYTIGEDRYKAIKDRTSFFKESVDSVWRNYDRVADPAIKRGVGSEETKDEATRAILRTAQIHALLSLRQIRRLIYELHDDFESVIGSRGLRTRPGDDLAIERALLRGPIMTPPEADKAQMSERASMLERELRSEALRRADIHIRRRARVTP